MESMTFEEWFAVEYPQAFHLGYMRRREDGEYDVEGTRQAAQVWRAATEARREKDAIIAECEYTVGVDGLGIAKAIRATPVEED